MSNLKQIREKIGSTQEITKITKVVQTIATAKFKSARDLSFRSDRFLTLCKDNLRLLNPILQQNINQNTNKLDISLFDDKTQKIVKNYESPYSKDEFFGIIVNSKRGLCGSLNSGIAKYVFNYINKNFPDGSKINLMLIGDKVKPLLKTLIGKKYQVNFIDKSNLYNENLSLLELNNGIENIIDIISKEQIKNTTVFYTKFESTTIQKPDFFHLYDKITNFGNASDDFESDDNCAERDLIIPNSDSDMKLIIKKIFQQIVFGVFYKAIRNTIASEYALKMSSMDSATKNGEKLLYNLKIQYNKARQNSITSELIDLIGGINALAEKN